MRAFVAVSVLGLILAGVGVGIASAATVDGGISGLGTGESSSESSGFGHLDTSQCVIGAIPVSQTETTYYRCTLEFGIETVPENAVVTAATLSIYTDAMDPCGSNACGMILSGYVGDAATTLSDLTAGSQIGEEVMATGAYSRFDVKTFVKSVLAGPDLAIAGFNLKGDPQNPTGAWTVVGSPAGAHPPTLVVTYAIPTAVTVAIAQAGTGSVGAEGSSINCPGTCTDTYLPGATVKLHANPSNGNAFSKWVGAPCAGQGSVCSFTMPDTAVSVTAVFVSTAPPTAAPTTPGKTRPPAGPTTAPGQPTLPPVTDAPSVGAVTAAPIVGPTAAPTILGIDDPGVQPASDSGVPTTLIILVVAAVAAVAIGFGVYRYAAARTPKG
jgi:hypothetical protein